jgi:hypothetical protein
MVESLLGVDTGANATATAPLFKLFLSCGNDLLSEDGLAVIPAEARVLLEKVASELGVSIEGLRQILRETAQRMAEDGKSGAPLVTVEVLIEDGDEVEDREDAMSFTGSSNGSDADDLRDRFGVATLHDGCRTQFLLLLRMYLQRTPHANQFMW